MRVCEIIRILSVFAATNTCYIGSKRAVRHEYYEQAYQFAKAIFGRRAYRMVQEVRNML